jgi:hypothetical protein
VDGTFIWMKSFHITVSEGTGDLDPVRRSVSAHPPRRGIFWQDSRTRSSGSAAQALPNRYYQDEQSRPTPRPCFLLSRSFSSSHPPSVRHTYYNLSLSSLYLFEKRSCLFVPGPDLGQRPEAPDTTILNLRRDILLAKKSSTPAELDLETSAIHASSRSQPSRNSPSAPPIMGGLPSICRSG